MPHQPTPPDSPPGTQPGAQPHTPPRRFAQTRTARLARARLARHLQGFGTDEDLWWQVQALVPEAWATVEEDLDCEEEKVKITLRLDASVAALFRAMGKGYQARIAHILATYARMRMGEIARQAAEMQALIRDYGVIQSDAGREAYLKFRDVEGLLDPEAKAKLDAAFGVR